jgi:hypothetical protein
VADDADRNTDLGADHLVNFGTAVITAFAFLNDWGFRVVYSTELLVRFESNTRIIKVFQERNSFEVGVEIGRWVDTDRGVREQSFSLADVVTKFGMHDVWEFREMSGRTQRSLNRALMRLARLTRKHAVDVLSGDDAPLDELSVENAVRGVSQREARRASDLRIRANEAWRRKEFREVVSIYSELDHGLVTVALKAFERGRLDYALNAIREIPEDLDPH